MTFKRDFTPISIKHQGAVIANSAYIEEQSENIVCIYVDLKSKHAEITSYFGGDADDDECGVYVMANKRSLNLNDKVDRDEPTSIVFSDFNGWDVFAYGYSKYTLQVCLIRKRKKNNK